MKVILLQKIAGLGDIDDVCEVADGYARNFLFPKHLAIQASASAIAQINAHKKKLAKKAEDDLKTQQALADRLSSIVLEIKEKANDKGLLYAAVGPQRIVDELKKRKIEINKNQVEMSPIKEAGEFMAVIHLRHGLEANLNIIVST